MNDDSDRLDELLADYFDWMDQSERCDVAAFLRQAPQWSAQGELVESLKDYVSQTREVEQLATMTLSQWLDLDGNSAVGVDQAADLIGPEEVPARIRDYELLEEIGRGGMGVVYRARQVSLDRIVCVKMILQGRLAQQVEVERFLGEAKAMAALRHPHIVSVFDVGQCGDQYFFAMEYVKGQTLSEMTRGGPLSPGRAAEIVSVVAHAIASAHAQGVLHRDLKPANILIDAQGRPHVTDFGLAKRIETGSLTTTGALAGTPSYMAPEQTHGDRAANAACDVYGLGTVLYECLTARPPFQGGTPLDTLLQVRTTDPLRPSLLNPRLPRDLETVCLKCMAKSPAGRYATAAELVEELERFSRGEPIKARPISILARCGRWCRRNPLPVALAMTVVLAVLAVGAALFRSYVVTSATLSQLQIEQGKNEKLIHELRTETDHVASHLYLSRLRRISQAVNHGDVVEAEELLADLVPRRDNKDRRGWGWHYLHALTKQYSRSLAQHEGVARSVVADVDGERKWASLDERHLRLWDVASEEPAATIPMETNTGVLAYYRPLRRLAIGFDDGHVEVRASPFHDRATSLVDGGQRTAVRSLAWDHSGASLAVGHADGSVMLWDFARRAVRKRLEQHTDAVNALSFSRDGRWLASAGDDAVVHLFDAGGEFVTTLGRFQDWVNDVAFHPVDSRLAAVSQNGELQVWEIVDDPDAAIVARQLFSRSSVGGDALMSVRWNRQGTRIATGGSSWAITIWHAGSGQPQRRLYGHRGDVTSLDWPTDELLVSSSADGTVKAWDMSLAPDGGSIAPAAAPVRYVSWNPRNEWVAWRDVEGLTSIWNRQTRTRITQFSDSAVGATAVAWHPDGDRIALAREDSVLVYGIPREDQQLQLQATAIVWTVAWSPDGRFLAAAGSGKEIRLWNATDGRPVGVLKDHGQRVRTFCWTSNNQLCSVDETSTIRRWNVDLQREEARLTVDTTLLNSIAPSQDRSCLAVTTQEGPILVVDLATMQTRRTFRGHQSSAWDAVWLSDDRRLVSAGQDGTLRLWDLATGEEALRIHAHEAAVWSLDKSPHGLILVSAGADGEVRFWDASTSQHGGNASGSRRSLRVQRSNRRDSPGARQPSAPAY